MSIITLGATTDYRLLPVTHVETLTFTNGIRGFNANVTASFNVVQLLGALANSQTAVTGSVGGNHLDVYLGADTFGALSFLTFASWGPSDTVSLFGTAAADSVFGAAVATRVDGRAGNDAVFGDNSHDTLLGGLGNDTLNSVGGVVDGGDGIDRLFLGSTVFSSVVALNLQDGGGGRLVGSGVTITKVEKLTLFASGFNDSVTAGNLRDVIVGLGGNDLLNGMGGNDYLSGGDGNDTLSGGNGADLLVGGAGADRLVGGAGADRFVFETLLDSFHTAPDRIVDFAQGQDKIDLGRITDGLTAGGHTPLRFIGTADFALHIVGDSYSEDYEVRYEKTATETLVQIGFANFDGDFAESVIRLTGLYNLTAGDFIL
jgi:Ca2+-binding RTX toxin-like protein